MGTIGKIFVFEENLLKGNSEEKGLSSYNKRFFTISDLLGFQTNCKCLYLHSAAISLLFSTNVYHWKISLLQRTAKLLWTCAINILSTSPAHWTVLKSRGGACDCYEVHLPTCHRITSSYTPPNSLPMFFSGDHLIVHPHSHLLKARWVIQYEGEAITEPNGWLATWSWIFIQPVHSTTHSRLQGIYTYKDQPTNLQWCAWTFEKSFYPISKD